MNFKTIFKQVDFWLQILHIFLTSLALIFIPENFSFLRYRILKIHTVAFGIFGLAFLQILSVIANFLIYKSERSQYRKMYEILTAIFVITLFIINAIDSSSLTVLLALLLISPFLAFWYLGITFGEYKSLCFKDSWKVTLILLILILVILVFWQIITPHSY